MRSALIIAILATGVISIPAIGQSDPVTLRVGKLEKEMKAVQRKVFPNGVAVEPEMGAAQPGSAPGSPATAPIADLTARVDALESQLKSITGQVEQQGFRVKKLEDTVKASETRLKALEPVADVPATGGPMDVATPIAAQVDPVAPSKPAPKPAASGLAKPTASAARSAASTKADPKRKALIEAVEIPATADAVEDSYTYGFRLWQAKLYPEAQTKLKEFVSKNGSHKRASFAQNLLGRAYLDEGKPALASVAFYDNYQKMPRGERASESLYWLGISLTKLNKAADACKVFKEFEDVYGTRAPADLKTRVTKGRADAKCAA